MYNQILTSVNRSPKKCYVIKGQLPSGFDSGFKANQNSPKASELLLSQHSRFAEPMNLSLSVSNRGQLSDHKKPLSASKSKSQEDLFAVSAEKSYNDASQKIWRIKQMELENKVNLLTIENERLNNFLQDSVREAERLNDELYNTQGRLNDNQDSYSNKLNILLIENQKLDEVNHRLQEQLQNTKQGLSTAFTDEIENLHNMYKQRESEEQANHDRVIKAQEQQVSQLKDKITQLEQSYFNATRALQGADDHNSKLEQKLDLIITENTQLTNIIKSQEEQYQSLHDQLTANQQQHQQLVERFEREIRDTRTNEKNSIEELNRKHQAELQRVKQETLTEINDQLAELCSEIGNKEQRIRMLEKEQEDLKHQAQKQRSKESQHFMNLIANANEEKANLEREREVLLNEVQQQRDVAAKLEQNIVRQTKAIIAKEHNAKGLQAKFQELQMEVQNTKAQVRLDLDNRDSEISSLRNKLDIMLSENETLREQVRVTEREGEVLQSKVRSLNLEFDSRLSLALTELNTKRDREVEGIYKEQAETIRREQKARETLERRLGEHSQIRKSLESQLEHLKKSEQLADTKISELLRLNEDLEREAFAQKDTAYQRTQEAKAAQHKLQLIEKNYELEKESLRNQMLQMSEDFETLKLEKEQFLLQTKGSQFVTKIDLQNKVEILREEIQTKTKLLNQTGTENLQITERLSRLEKENAKNSDLVHSQRLQLENQRIELKQTTEGFSRNFREREADLLNKIQGQQHFIEEITTKYNDVIKKAKKYRQHLKVLRDSAYRGRDSEFTSTKRTFIDQIYDDENEGLNKVNSQSMANIGKNQTMKVIEKDYCVEPKLKPYSSMGRPASAQRF